ncbi:MAG: MarR family transcriptional regulator [Nocardioides sp.]|nr:MarR family transcriptional regulator [Nocardioides sp.]
MDEREQLARRIEDFFERLIGSVETESLNALAEVDMTFTQARTVMLLSSSADPMPINEIATHLGVSVAAAGRNVDRLAAAGMATREESTHDRRVKLVGLSAAGRELLEQHMAVKRASLLGFVRRLPDEHVRAFDSALEPILAGDYLAPVASQHDGHDSARPSETSA